MPNTPPQNETRSWFEEPTRGGGGDRPRDAKPGDTGAATSATPPSGSPATGEPRPSDEASTADPVPVAEPTDRIAGAARGEASADRPAGTVPEPTGERPDAPASEQPAVDVLPSEHDQHDGRQGSEEATERWSRPDSEATMPAAHAVPTRPVSRQPPDPAGPDPAGTPSESSTATLPVASPRPGAPGPSAARPASRPVEEAATETIPVVPAAPHFDRRPAAGYASDATTEIPRIAGPATSHRASGQPQGDQDPATVNLSRLSLASWFAALSDDRRRLLTRGGIAAAAMLGFFVLLYGADLAMSRGEVPRGVTVGGVEVGGMQPTAAEDKLREELEPRLARPVALRAGTVQTSLDPKAAGLTLDWPRTIDQAGTQPLNPWTRLVSLFSTREVGVVTHGDRETLTAALVGLLPQIDRAPAEGTIRFEGAQPIPVDPQPGQRLDVGKSAEVVSGTWANGGVLNLPVVTTPVSTTPAGIRATLRDVVEPAVSGPVTVTGEGDNAALKPDEIAAALRFAPDGKGGLTTTVDHPSVVGALGPDLAGTEKQGKDAEIVLQGGTPVVLPSVEGRAIDWEKSLGPVLDVLRRTDGRTLPAIYMDKHPKLTTEQANQLGITSQISSFTTKGFAQDSGQNIKRVAEQVSGAVVRPGETFSLNGYTGPRTAAAGYVEAGIIDHGRPGRGIGGGISQFATTLYNAGYFAGMTDVEHKEHSYYISRYPAAREATVFEGAIDVKFRNDTPTGVLIQTEWTSSTITVTLWGTKHVNVESIPGPRTDPTQPTTQVIQGEPCSAAEGKPGFTTTDTRVVRDANSGAEISRRTHTAVYKPEPKVICEPGPPPPPPPGG